MPRQAAPTALKLVKGERKDRINTAEPTPAEGEVLPPADLSTEALEIWSHYAPDLIAKRVLTPWDVEEFGAWCDAAARRREAGRHLNTEGTVIESPVFNRNGERTGFRIVKSEWWYVWKEATDSLVKIGGRFGMTPSERASLKVGDADDNSGQDLLT